MSDRSHVQVTQGQRLDQALLEAWPDLGRLEIRQLIQEGAVLVNGQPARKAGQYVEIGDLLDVAVPEAASENVVGVQPPSLIPDLAIVYADEVVLVVDKPACLPIYPSRRHRDVPTLAQQLYEYAPDLAHVGGAERAGIVQQLDAESSGLVLVARTKAAYRTLQREVKRQRVIRRFSVLVEGEASGTEVIEAPLGSASHERGRTIIAREGRPARTAYRVLRRYRDQTRTYSLLEVTPEGSRRHQIRAHLAWYGYPVVGDRWYGSRFQPLLDYRLFLHLSRLEFPHPETATIQPVESQLPADLQGILRYLTRPKSS